MSVQFKIISVLKVFIVIYHVIFGILTEIKDNFGFDSWDNQTTLNCQK